MGSLNGDFTGKLAGAKLGKVPGVTAFGVGNVVGRWVFLGDSAGEEGGSMFGEVEGVMVMDGAVVFDCNF